MHLTPLSSITINERQRKSFNEQKLQELADSIRDLGLLHPPVLRSLPNGELHLIAGERRVRAMELLHDLGESFECNGQPVPSGEIPFLYLSELSDREAFQAELEENLRRVNLSWQEEVAAVAKLHAMEQASNPKADYLSTGEKIVEITGQAIETARKEVSNAVALAPYMDDPDVRKAENTTAALRIVKRKLKQEIAEHRLEEPVNPRFQLFNADSAEFLKTYTGPRFQMVLADPPYGIGSHKHNYSDLPSGYEDTDEIGIDFAESVIPLLPSVIDQSGAWVFWFCDFKFFAQTREIFRRCGFTPWELPIIWHKSGGTGVAPIHYYGFRRTYECILAARWGDRELLSIQSDVIIEPPCEPVYHRHEKPVELYRRLYRLTLGVGEFVLDPCCGSGTSFEAGQDLQLNVVGIEKSPEIYRIAETRLREIGYV